MGVALAVSAVWGVAALVLFGVLGAAIDEGVAVLGAGLLFVAAMTLVAVGATALDQGCAARGAQEAAPVHSGPRSPVPAAPRWAGVLRAGPDERTQGYEIAPAPGTAGGVVIVNSHDHVVLWREDRASAESWLRHGPAGPDVGPGRLRVPARRHVVTRVRRHG